MDDTKRLGKGGGKSGRCVAGRTGMFMKECAMRGEPYKSVEREETLEANPGTEIGSRPDADPGEQANHPLFGEETRGLMVTAPCAV